MAHPTVNSQRTVLPGNAIVDGTILGPQVGTNTVGLTQAATAIQRSVLSVNLGGTPAAGKVYSVFRSPPSGATITAAYVCPGSIQNHAVNEADTWVFALNNKTTGLRLCKQNPSLSNTTLAATAFVTIPLNNGNSTVLSGHTLQISTSASGSPVALNWPLVVLEWTPYSNA